MEPSFFRLITFFRLPSNKRKLSRIVTPPPQLFLFFQHLNQFFPPAFRILTALLIFASLCSNSPPNSPPPFARWGGKWDTGHGSAGISGQVGRKTGHRERFGEGSAGKYIRRRAGRWVKRKWTDPGACPEQIYKSIWTIFQTQASPPSSSPPYWEMLSSGSVDSAEASAEDPATSSFSASSSPSSQRSRASASSVLSLILTK